MKIKPRARVIRTPESLALEVYVGRSSWANTPYWGRENDFNGIAFLFHDITLTIEEYLAL